MAPHIRFPTVGSRVQIIAVDEGMDESYVGRAGYIEADLQSASAKPYRVQFYDRTKLWLAEAQVRNCNPEPIVPPPRCQSRHAGKRFLRSASSGDFAVEATPSRNNAESPASALKKDAKQIKCIQVFASPVPASKQDPKQSKRTRMAESPASASKQNLKQSKPTRVAESPVPASKQETMESFLGRVFESPVASKQETPQRKRARISESPLSASKQEPKQSKQGQVFETSVFASKQESKQSGHARIADLPTPASKQRRRQVAGNAPLLKTTRASE